MSVILQPDQIMCALKNAGHPLADQMLQGLWELTQSAAAMLEVYTTGVKIEGYEGSGIVRTSPATTDSKYQVFDDKMMVGFTAVHAYETDGPVPFFLDGMDDEGWQEC